MRDRSLQELFFVSFVILFFELACIRWFGATVVFLTFFTNVVLLAGFLGTSIGCLAASRKPNLIAITLPVTALACCLAFIGSQLYVHAARFAIDIGNQAAPQIVYYGTEDRALAPSQVSVPIWMFMGLFFLLIALAFCGLGQTMGRLFDRARDPIRAYVANIAGSLAGIGMFFTVSWLWLPAAVWFAIALGGVTYFLRKHRGPQLAVLALVVLLTAQGPTAAGDRTVWSPYYKIRYHADTRLIQANSISHQYLYADCGRLIPYVLPYALRSLVSNERFRDILTIGAGSGNDVASALANGDENTRIDAVEIDPAIAALGREFHPDRPYSDPRVTLYADDGRSFLTGHPEKKYDLIVYPIIDSLVLHSGYSSLRLESFLYTEQAFQSVRDRLKPGGVFVIYSFYRHGWIVGRLVDTVRSAFGSEPLLLTFPKPLAELSADEQTNSCIFLMAGNKDSAIVSALRAKLGSTQMTGESGPRPTDDWPFLYLKRKAIPFSPSAQGMLVMAVVSVLLLWSFSPGGSIRLDRRMFFLGAGFMLLETRGVIQMALFFGSTWIVNSIVFAGILVMVLLANLYVLQRKPRDQRPYYLLLFGWLIVNASFPMRIIMQLSPAPRAAASAALILGAVFFAGVIFAMAFSQSKEPHADMASNIAGVLLGGLSEYFSLVIGIRGLLAVAFVYYLLSVRLGRGRRDGPV